MSEIENKLKELDKFDFSTDAEFNIEENYKLVEGFKIERENLKQSESENILTDLAPTYVEKTTLEDYQAKKENLRNFMRKFSADKEIVFKMSNETGGERDKLYMIANFLYNSFALSLNEITFTLKFTYEEFDFIIKTLNQKLEYNSDEVFQMIKFKNEGFDKYQDIFKRNKNVDVDFTTNISNIVLLYHLLTKYKTSGINKQFELFASILNKIGESNQVFNALNIVKDRLNQEFILWTTSISPEEKIEDTTSIVQKP